jgi:Uma2 family endonuclease
MDTAVHTHDTVAPAEGFPLIVHVRPVFDLTDEQFFEFCQINRELRIERTAQGELVIMPPAGWETSERNAEISMQLRIWAKREGTGTTADSSGGFILPNKATRSPDAAWVTHTRLATLTPEQREKFIPLCPDFVIELRSQTDTLSALQAKMREYLDNGARLGWLIDRVQRRVYVYRPQMPVECLENPDTISGEPILSGFILDLREVW